jgi:asparagine synthase (glutamine-hydrolysing)
MCGINGFNFVDRRLIKKMNDSIKHRGPDSEGILCNNGISLGHRRLAIIDLSKKGNQPMIYEHKKKKAIIVFNGEIYNFLELKKELEGKGYKFNTKTDTEVILASYLEWGADCVKKFDGMWAFCIYDLKNKILFLSRDRVGKKPLHYYFDGKRFIFSSEIKGLLEHDIKKEINPKAIDFYFSLGFIPAPYSIYQGIFKLEAAKNLIFYLKEKKIKEEFYWEIPKYEPVFDDEKLMGEGKKLFEESVKKRLISDVPLGAFLSGGLDSSLIISEMIKNIERENLNTFSIGFHGKYDESKYMEIANKFYRTNNYHKYFKEDDFKGILESIFYYYDEPFADISMFPAFFLSKFAREKLIVSLSGDGGDEVFGGYPRYIIAKQLEVIKKIPVWIRKIMIKIPIYKLKEGVRLSFFKKEDFYSEARQDVYKPQIVKESLRKRMAYFLEKSDGNLLEAVRMMDINFYTLPENFLHKVDMSSMANALEVRCPFLDYKLIEYSCKIPSKLKVSVSDYKLLMKKIFNKELPKKILKRKKQGFTPPIAEWINKEGYINELSGILKILVKNSILDKNWENFYNGILSKNNKVYNNYKIRLLLFFNWYKYWIKEK